MKAEQIYKIYVERGTRYDGILQRIPTKRSGRIFAYD